MKQAQLATLVGHHFDGASLTSCVKLTGGVSADTWRLTIDRDGQAETLVVRIHGEHHSGHSAADEFAILDALWRAGLPVPRPLAFDSDCQHIPWPCIFIGFVAGTTAMPAGDNAIVCMARQLADIHRYQPELDCLPQRCEPYPEMLDFLPEGPEWTPLTEQLARQPPPAFSGIRCMLHGDYWPENILWHQNNISAVLDWEDAAIGDALSDIACCQLELRYRFGKPIMQAFLTAYQAERPTDMTHLPYWQIYVAAAAQKYMSLWRLPPEREAHMRSEALAMIREASEQLLAPPTKS
ncbi:MAG: phosphotransferase [Pseudomonadales bacterium]|nr:phosphotransferase [Pseudomonadales bacterium]